MPKHYLLTAAILSLCTLQVAASCAQGDLSAATQWYHHHEWEKAAAEFSKIASGASDREERTRLLYYAGESHLQAQNYDQAEQVFSQLVQQNAGEFQPQALFRLAEAAHYLGNDAQARQLLSDFVARYPTHKFVLPSQKLLADIALAEGQFETAAAIFQRVIASEGDDSVRAVACLSLSRALMQQNRHAEVEFALAEILENPDSELQFAALMLRGQALYESDNYTTALESFRQAEASSLAPSEKATARLASSWALWKLDRCEEIEEELEKLEDEGPLHSQVVYLAGMTAYRKQDWDTAFNRLRKASSEPHAPHHAASLFYCGECKLRLKEAKVAIDWFFKLIEIEDTSPWLDDACWGMIRAACQLKNIDKLELALEVLRDRCPQSPYLQQLKAMKHEDGTLPDLVRQFAVQEHSFEQAVRLERDGFFDGALAAYRSFLSTAKQSPLRAEALWRMANLEERHGGPMRALQFLEQLRSEEPEFDRMPELLLSMARLYENQGETLARSEIMQTVLNDFPDSNEAAYAAYTLAVYALDNDAIDEAWQNVQDALKVLKRSPDREDVQLERQTLCLKCLLLSKRACWEEIAALASENRESLGQDQLSARILFWQAEAEFRLEEFDTAAKQFDDLSVLTAAVFEPWVSMIDLRRAQIAARSQRWDAVLALAQNLLLRCPEFEYSYECDYLQGRAHAGRGEMSAAREAYGRVLTNALANGTETQMMAQWMIGETYFHQQNYGLAEAAYIKVIAGHEFPEWQARAALQAGKCAELQEEWERAEEIYSGILDTREQTSVAQEIRARLRWTTRRLAARNEVLLK